MTTTPTLLGLTGREYLRNSHKRQKSINDQRSANERAIAAESNCTLLPDFYVDKGSASKFRREKKPRGDFQRLITDLENGMFGADFLAMYTADRAGRQVGEWDRLVKLLDSNRIRVYVTTENRFYDVWQPTDYQYVMGQSVEAAVYSMKLSRVVLNGIVGSAEEGKPHGKIPYGFRREYPDKETIVQLPDENEAPHVAELIDRLFDGVSLSAIASDWKQRGITTREGKPFTAQRLRTMAMNYAYIGKRVHDPERHITGRRSEWLSPDAKIVDAQWPAIVNERKFLRVQAMFAGRRGTMRNGEPIQRDGQASHWLTWCPGVVCDECGGMLGAKVDRKTGAQQYRCKAGHLTIDMAELDKIIKGIVLSYLAREDNFVPRDNGAEDAELEQVRTDLAYWQGELDSLADSGVSVALAAKKEPGILANIARLRDRERELTTPAELDGPLAPGPDIAERWERASLGAQRAMVRLLTTPRYVGPVSITAARYARNVPVRDRLVFGRS